MREDNYAYMLPVRKSTGATMKSNLLLTCRTYHAYPLWLTISILRPKTKEKCSHVTQDTCETQKTGTAVLFTIINNLETIQPASNM